jgi:hypothetical protein
MILPRQQGRKRCLWRDESIGGVGRVPGNGQAYPRFVSYGTIDVAEARSMFTASSRIHAPFH